MHVDIICLAEVAELLLKTAQRKINMRAKCLVITRFEFSIV